MAIKKGTTKRIDGKLMRWNGKKWVKSQRKVGGELTKSKSSALAKKPPSAITKAKSSAITKSSGGKLTKTQSKSITKSPSGKLTKTNNKIKPSTTANTSRDTVKGSGTRTGQPGKNRKLISASKPKPKPKPTLRSRLSSAGRNISNEAWLRSAKTATNRGLLNQTLRTPAQLVGNKFLRGGANLAAQSFWLDQLGKTGSKIFNPNDNLLLSAANLAQVARGKKSFGNSPLAQLRNQKLDRDAYLADPNKAPGAIEDFDQLTPAQMAEVQASLSSGTASPNAPPLTHAEMRAELNRDFPLPTKSKNIVKKKEVKKKKKTAKELWINKTRNSPAALSGVFDPDERWELHQKHQAWRKRTGRA